MTTRHTAATTRDVSMATGTAPFEFGGFAAAGKTLGKALRDTVQRRHPMEREPTSAGHFDSTALVFGPDNDDKDFSVRFNKFYSVNVAYWRSEPAKRYVCVIRRLDEEDAADRRGAPLAADRLLWAKMAHPALRRCLHESYDSVMKQCVYLLEPPLHNLESELELRLRIPTLSNEELATLIIDLTSATDYLHSHNFLVHRSAYHPARIVYRGSAHAHPFALESGLLYLKAGDDCASGVTRVIRPNVQLVEPCARIHDSQFDRPDWDELRERVRDANNDLLRTLVKLIHHLLMWAPSSEYSKFKMPVAKENFEDLRKESVSRFDLEMKWFADNLDIFLTKCIAYFNMTDVPSSWTFGTISDEARQLLQKNRGAADISSTARPTTDAIAAAKLP